MNGQAPLPQRILGRLIGLVIIVTGIAAAVMAARTNSANPRTDDAYVSANVIGIAPHVEGPLVKLNVVDNQAVEENDLLFVIDPRPYEAELQRAQSELIVAQAEVGGIGQAIAAARAEVDRLQADMAYARTHAGRLEPLVGGRFISADQYQEAVSKAKSLEAAVQQAQAQLAQQEKLLAQQGDVNGRLETAKARVRLAELNVEYCYVRAPFKGLVTNLNISVGDSRTCRRARVRSGRRAHVVRAGELPRDPVAGDQAGHGGSRERGRLSRAYLSRNRAGDCLERSIARRTGRGARTQDRSYAELGAPRTTYSGAHHPRRTPARRSISDGDDRSRHDHWPPAESNVVALAWRADQAHRIAQRIAGGVDFGAQAAAGTTKTLGIRPPFSRRAPAAC